jgi:hypothetical protein
MKGMNLLKEEASIAAIDLVRKKRGQGISRAN